MVREITIEPASATSPLMLIVTRVFFHYSEFNFVKIRDFKPTN
jgi:hypothetical protein